MSQAAREFNEAEWVLAQLGADEETAKRLNPLIGDTPGETVQTCSEVADFLGQAGATIEHTGGAKFGEAAWQTLQVVAAALRYEAVRVEALYERNKKPSPEARQP